MPAGVRMARAPAAPAEKRLARKGTVPVLWLGSGLRDLVPAGTEVDYGDGSGWIPRARPGGHADEGSSNFSVPGADVGIDASVVPELDLTYFFNRGLAVAAGSRVANTAPDPARRWTYCFLGGVIA